MAKYTTQIRSIVESEYPLFDFDYPIFDENYRKVLEQKIIDYYYFREIGLETVGQFKHFLKSKLNTIMPYYNKLYETEGLVTVENYNINLDNTITRTNKVNTTSNSSSNGTSTSNANSREENGGTSTETEDGRQVFSDTPQAKLNNLDYATNLTDNDVTRTNVDEGTSSSESSQTVNDNTDVEGKLTTLEEYTEHLLGNGSMRYNADILMEFRKSFINIDQLIIRELNDLFMNVY